MAAWIAMSAGNVKVYRDHLADSDVLATLSAGDELTVLVEGSDWCRVQVGSKTGYVQRRVITFEEPREIIETRYVSTQKDSLALRDKPQTRDSRVLRHIPRAAKVKLIEDVGDWAYIEYDGERGYSTMRYLSRTKPDEVSSMPSDVLLDATLQDVTGWEATIKGKNGSSVELRQWCAASAPLICEIEDGARVKLTRKGGVWCRIIYEGEEGYCLTSRLELIAPAD